MSRYSRLFKDLALFTLSDFLPRVISFLLVPLYTNCLTTAEYGISDILNTTGDLLIPILALNVSSSVLRFTIEEKENAQPVQLGYKMTLLATGLVTFVTIVLVSTKIITLPVEYMVLFVLRFALMELYSTNIAYLRAEERVSLLAFISVLFTAIDVGTKVLFLVVFQWGLWGFMLSTVVSYTAVNLMMFIRVRLWYVLRGMKWRFDQYQKEMLAYSSPLVASGIAWWINSASDRYFVTFICGEAANGVYSIAYKIPTILQTFQSIFSQAWLLSVYREYKKKDGAQYIGNVYKVYSGAMVLCCSMLIFLDIPISKILFSNDFFYAWKYVPVLLISVLLVSLSSFFGIFLQISKESKLSAKYSIISAGVNTFFNALLIPVMGPQGAAIATALGYVTSTYNSVRRSYAFYPFPIEWGKQGCMVGLLILEAIIMVCWQNYVFCGIIVLILLAINWKSLTSIIHLFGDKLLGFLK